MNGIIKLFSEYGKIAPAVIAIAAIAIFITDKLAKGNSSFRLKEAVATVVSIALYAIYDAAFVYKKLVFGTNAPYFGLICGSLAVGVVAFIKKAKSGKASICDFAALISAFLDGFVDGENKLALVEKILSIVQTESEENIFSEIKNLLIKEAAIDVPNEKIEETVKKIIDEAKTQRKIK